LEKRENLKEWGNYAVPSIGKKQKKRGENPGKGVGGPNCGKVTLPKLLRGKYTDLTKSQPTTGNKKGEHLTKKTWAS